MHTKFAYMRFVWKHSNFGSNYPDNFVPHLFPGGGGRDGKKTTIKTPSMKDFEFCWYILCILIVFSHCFGTDPKHSYYTNEYT